MPGDCLAKSTFFKSSPILCKFSDPSSQDITYYRNRIAGMVEPCIAFLLNECDGDIVAQIHFKLGYLSRASKTIWKLLFLLESQLMFSKVIFVVDIPIERFKTELQNKPQLLTAAFH